MYIGGAASLSFLQVVRNMVADQIGPSQFSHSAKSDTMLEKESSSSPAVVPPSHSIELDAESRLDYVDCYRAVVSCTSVRHVLTQRSCANLADQGGFFPPKNDRQKASSIFLPLMKSKAISGRKQKSTAAGPRV